VDGLESESLTNLGNVDNNILWGQNFASDIPNMDDVGDDIDVDYMSEELDSGNDSDCNNNIKPKKLLTLEHMKCAMIFSLRLTWNSVH